MLTLSKCHDIVLLTVNTKHKTSAHIGRDPLFGRRADVVGWPVLSEYKYNSDPEGLWKCPPKAPLFHGLIDHSCSSQKHDYCKR